MSQSIADKIDDLLKSDATFTTRSGVRFLTEVIRDAYKYIEDDKKYQQQVNDEQRAIKNRLTNVENALNEFLDLRKKEQEKAETERSRWRWAIITPTIGLLFTMITLIITLWLKP
jgi:Arc/MetJ-type ribon-helix-helix transcriptional regulator